MSAASDDNTVDKLKKFAFLSLLGCGVSLLVYQTYRKYVAYDRKKRYMDDSDFFDVSDTLDTEWRDESKQNGIDGAPVQKPAVRTSMLGIAEQQNFQKHGSGVGSLLPSPSQSFDASMELLPTIHRRPSLLFAGKHPAEPKLDVSPTFLGESSYRETAIFLLALAMRRVYPDQEMIVQNTFKFGLGVRTYFCSFARSSKHRFTAEQMDAIGQEMSALSKQSLELSSKFVDHDTCLEVLQSTKQMLSYRLVETLNRPAYRMVGTEVDNLSFYILQYRSTLNNTKYVQRYKLHVSEDDDRHFIIKIPQREDERLDNDGKSPSKSPSKSPLPPLDDPDGDFRQPKAIRELFQRGNEMGNFLDINGVSDINAVIRDGRFKELMLVSEAYHNRQIVKISNKVAAKTKDNAKIRIILISGPSSSGKTTFAAKLGIQLKLLGFTPTVLEVDMFFRDRSDPVHPRDSKGRLNFEHIGAVNTPELNDAINALLDGKPAKMPNFSFKTGSREGYQKEPVTLHPQKGVLIMEGIFCLNPELLSQIKNIDAVSYKIFICPISPFYALDNYHFISEQMIRLIRRISRDHFHRGNEAEHTVFKWGQLTEGEDINIFPYVKYADSVFNSSLLYELSVLKTYSYPLLQTVPKSSNQYKDAQNIISFLDMFFAMPDRSVPQDSLLMEFIGSSIFEEM